MILLRPLFFLVLAAICCAPPSVFAKTADELHQVEEQLSAKKAQQEQLDQASRDAGKRLEDLRAKLIDSAHNLQEKDSEQDRLEEKLDTLTDEIADKSKNADEEKKQLAQMVTALVEIASRPPESLFLQDHVMEDHIHRSVLLKAILPRLKQETEAEVHDLSALYELQKKVAAQKKLVEDAHEKIMQQQADLDGLIAERQNFLNQTEQQKTDIAAHVEKLAAEAQDLRQLMEKVAAQTPPSKAEMPRSSVALKWPVSGNVKRHFGDQDNDGVISEGLTVAAPSGAPIVAPYAGKVVFAGAFRGYGQIVILQHGNAYHSFLSGFGRIDAQMGQEVAAGEPLGILPSKTGAKPELYFEWRNGDQPADPTNSLPRRL